MKLRALGTGSASCRHPLVTSSFLLRSEDAHVVFGCGAGVPAKLEATGIPLSQVRIWVPLSARLSQISGLEELALTGEAKSTLAGPGPLLTRVKEALDRALGFDSALSFTYAPSRHIKVREEHQEECIHFVENHLTQIQSVGLLFDQAEIFITGETPVNEEFIHRFGAGAQVILHQAKLPEISELQLLPVYLQRKIWLYGYENAYLQAEVPLPMMFMPQGTDFYDSERKSALIDKERFLREDTKRRAGNTG